MDAWNYINRDCTTGWQGGASYTIDICNPTTVSCPPKYVAKEEFYGTYTNNTWTLVEGATCDVVIDASRGVGRVIFDETSYLGLIGTTAKLGSVITFTSGNENKIKIYNGAENGPLTFLISFSGSVTTGVFALASLFLISQTF